MEHDYSFNKQLRKQITARAEINKKIKTLEADIDEKNKKQNDVDKEINRIQKALSRRKQKNQDYREFYLRLSDKTPILEEK